jgi:hypothetical protein
LFIARFAAEEVEGKGAKTTLLDPGIDVWKCRSRSGPVSGEGVSVLA